MQLLLVGTQDLIWMTVFVDEPVVNWKKKKNTFLFFLNYGLVMVALVVY